MRLQPLRLCTFNVRLILNILIVTVSYPPEVRSASHLMLELAKELQLRSHTVTVVTTWPEYNIDASQRSQEFTEYTIENGISVLRVKTLPRYSTSYTIRALSQLLMPLQFLIKLYKYHIASDAVLVYSPPLPLALVGSWLQRRGAKNVLNVQDLFPQNAIDLGILRHSLQIKFFQMLERYAYVSANIVTVHSIGNRNAVERAYPEIAYKLRVLHNWVDIEHHSNSLAQINFRERWGISHKHIAIFAGVVGPSQYLDLLLEIAEKKQDNPDLLFLIVGDGTEKERLQAIAKEKSLHNVRFEGFVSRDAYPDLLSICSVGLVCLSPQNKTPVVPGKILGLMAAGLPIAAFLHEESDGFSIMHESQCGVAAISADSAACLKAFELLISQCNDFKEIGRRGQIYAREHFSKEHCVSQLEAIFLIPKSYLG